MEGDFESGCVCVCVCTGPVQACWDRRVVGKRMVRVGMKRKNKGIREQSRPAAGKKREKRRVNRKASSGELQQTAGLSLGLTDGNATGKEKHDMRDA